jgi:hypothetical protein
LRIKKAFDWHEERGDSRKERGEEEYNVAQATVMQPSEGSEVKVLTKRYGDAYAVARITVANEKNRVVNSIRYFLLGPA